MPSETPQHPEGDFVRSDPPCPGHPDGSPCNRDGLCQMSCGCIISGCSGAASGQRVLQGKADADLHLCSLHEEWVTITDWVTTAVTQEPDRSAYTGRDTLEHPP